MNNKLQAVRGTHYHLHDLMYNYNYIINKVSTISSNYGFKPMATPIFEFSKVFKKTLGESSDIVTKEMYTFLDKGVTIPSKSKLVHIINKNFGAVREWYEARNL